MDFWGGLLGWSWHVRREIKSILALGYLTKGKVLRVKPLPARINERTFFRVWVEFVEPNGTHIMGRDTIDNWATDFFVKARDNEEEVDVIKVPGVKRVILPMKLALGCRFD